METVTVQTLWKRERISSFTYARHIADRTRIKKPCNLFQKVRLLKYEA